MNHAELKANIARLELMQSEQIRLLSCISYAMWLKEHCIDTGDIKGYSVEPIHATQVARGEVKSWFRQHGLVMPEKLDRIISYHLKDGRKVSLPWPPYPLDVIQNKSRLPS